MGGQKRPLRRRTQIPEARVIEVGNIHRNARLFQRGHRPAAKGGQAFLRFAAGAQLVSPVPGEGEGPDAVPPQLFDQIQTAAQHGAALYRQKPADPAAGKGRRFRGIMELHQAPGMGRKLAVPKADHPPVVISCRRAPQAVRDENGKALAPSGGIGQGIQREHQLPVDQPQSPLFRLGQGIAVQVKQTKITRHPP